MTSIPIETILKAEFICQKLLQKAVPVFIPTKKSLQTYLLAVSCSTPTSCAGAILSPAAGGDGATGGTVLVG